MERPSAPTDRQSVVARVWSALVTGGQVVVVVVALIVAFAPGSSLRVWWSQQVEARRVARVVEERWDDLTRGARLDGNPLVTVVEFGDYECPFCRVQHRILMDLAREDPSVGVAYHQLPLPSVHPRAVEAASAAICAESQGVFGPMHEFLFATSEWQVEGDWAEVARQTGVRDLGAFEACMKAPSTNERIAAEKALAEAVGVRGTPSFVFRNGAVWEGSMQPEEILALVPR